MNCFDKEDFEDPCSAQTRVDLLRSKEEEDNGDNKENVAPHAREQLFTPNKPRNVSKVLPRSPFLDITPPAAKKKGDKHSSGRRTFGLSDCPSSPKSGLHNSNAKQFR